ncbi:MAG: twin-arginine translocase TatA/TatE family subunit [Chloroflexi bacterium]|nr:twin-arginine translocase TatA/TatE family subunit [Chloroflexota bacterium]
MGHLGTPELIIILVIVVVIFGAGKLPELGGALGKGIKEFRSASKDIEGATKDVQEVADMAKIDKV